jgi:UDP-N-acetylglucosamine 2-epimerase (non-hydrolysing)
MTRFEQVCLEERPDWIIVVGDVNSTMACTLVSAKLGIKVAHVEAGLRSFDRSMPEEVNRVVTDALADLLLTPSEDANENLTREGVPTSRIRLVGNVMIDSLIANLEKARASALIGQLGLQQSGFVFVTLHRPSNVDDQHVLRALMHELRRISERIPIVFPIHPRTREKCERFDISLHEDARFRVIDPIGYHDSLCLTEAARIVLTDSGGLQEESTYFRTPCLTVRPNTERPVTLTVGSNALTDLHMLSSDVDDCLRGNRHRGSVPGLWDGRAAGRIVDCIVAAS